MTTSFLSPILSNPVAARLAFYPSLLYGLLKQGSQRRWYDHIEEGVILGGLPLHNVAKHLVVVEKIKALVSVTEDYETRFLTPTDNQWKEMGVSRVKIPTVDYNNAPSVDQLVYAVNFIEKHKKLMNAVYVHCKAGRSRSATVIVCYLMRTRHVTADEAICIIRGIRPHVVFGTSHMSRISEFYDKVCKVNNL